MAREFAKKFYHTQAWKKTREAYIKSVGGLCERCLAKGLIVPATMVHHKIYISPENINDTSVTLNWDNLEALCTDCHAEEHAKESKRYKVDEFGRVTVRI
jgi:5-methylcytosine-specific restriction endonuclease McrA